jgi:hypothetical protein
MRRHSDCATFFPGDINLNCVAPSGASVTATVGGRKVAMKQAAATAQAAFPLVYRKHDCGECFRDKISDLVYLYRYYNWKNNTSISPREVS